MARLSTNTIIPDIITLQLVNTAPIQNTDSIEFELATLGLTTLFQMLPNRLTANPIPMTNATSLPSNQSDTIVDWATHNDSARRIQTLPLLFRVVLTDLACRMSGITNLRSVF